MLRRILKRIDLVIQEILISKKFTRGWDLKLSHG